MGTRAYSPLILLLILGLTPRPGEPQGAFHYCPGCKSFRDIDQHFEHLVKTANITICPHNVIRFQLPRITICTTKLHSRVTEAIDCINKGRTHCLQSSKTQQDFSKGSDKKPPTTTQAPLTSTAKTAPPLRQSTQTWTGGTLKPSDTTTEVLGGTQKIPEETIGLFSTKPDLNQNKDLLHGKGPTAGQVEAVKSKMDQMKIAIISLMLIVLVMTSVGMYVWCKKGRFPQCKKRCDEEAMKYQRAASEETIESGR